ncbi:MAG: hypothetical protein EU530_01255 [Promethearchaeota archaeon]|nr:MAG: hypothetical protein EU530_01255 [Candidatus Lokiarchaeota archaeon]
MEFFEESNPCDVDIENLLNVLRQDFKNVKAKDLKFIYHGTYNVFEFRKNILRVPDKALRNHKGVQLIQNESLKLKSLANFLSIPIPQPEKISLDEKMPYMMYKKLPGVSLSSVFSSMTPQNKKTVAIGIADFLNQLHSPHVLHQVHSKLFYTNFSTFEYKTFWEKRFEEIKEKVFPLVNELQKAWIYSLFSAYLRNPANFRFKQALSHCDFDTSNILVHPQKGFITGIIDFEETKAWDPAADLLFYEDLTFQQQILDSYNFSDSKSLQNRMKFLYCWTFVPYIIWGKDHDKHAMVEYGLKRLEFLHQQYPFPLQK